MGLTSKIELPPCLARLVARHKVLALTPGEPTAHRYGFIGESRDTLCHRGIGRTFVLLHGDMRGLTHQLYIRKTEALRNAVQSRGFRGCQRRLPRAAIAIDPLHEVDFLARPLHQIAQERLLIVG